MSKVPTLVIAPCVESCLREQFLVKPLPACASEERLVWDAEGRTGESMPVDGVLVVGVKSFLQLGNQQCAVIGVLRKTLQ